MMKSRKNNSKQNKKTLFISKIIIGIFTATVSLSSMCLAADIVNEQTVSNFI